MNRCDHPNIELGTDPSGFISWMVVDSNGDFVILANFCPSCGCGFENTRDELSENELDRSSYND